MNKLACIVCLLLVIAPARSDAAGGALRVVLGGDVMFGRVTDDEVRPHGGPDPFRHLRGVLQRADVAMVNLEAGVCDRPSREPTGFPLLVAPPDRLPELAAAGVDVINVANNHALDCGSDGLRTASNETGLQVAGLEGSPAVEHASGVVVLGVTTHPPPYADGPPRPWFVPRTALSSVISRVERLRSKRPDSLIIVSVHWGRERHVGPAGWQRTSARRMIDAGANVVAGHGSHVAEPTEEYGGGFIAYGLGNLLFDDLSPAARRIPLADLSFVRRKDRWVLEEASLHWFRQRGREHGPGPVE